MAGSSKSMIASNASTISPGGGAAGAGTPSPPPKPSSVFSRLFKKKKKTPPAEVSQALSTSGPTTPNALSDTEGAGPSTGRSALMSQSPSMGHRSGVSFADAGKEKDKSIIGYINLKVGREGRGG
jgi:hypothetical protein